MDEDGGSTVDEEVNEGSTWPAGGSAGSALDAYPPAMLGLRLLREKADGM